MWVKFKWQNAIELRRFLWLSHSWLFKDEKEGTIFVFFCYSIGLIKKMETHCKFMMLNHAGLHNLRESM